MSNCMKQQLETIRQLALKAIEEAEDQQGLENLRVKYLGKKGELTAVLKGMNFEEGATAKERNGTIGGHKA